VCRGAENSPGGGGDESFGSRGSARKEARGDAERSGGILSNRVRTCRAAIRPRYYTRRAAARTQPRRKSERNSGHSSAVGDRCETRLSGKRQKQDEGIKTGAWVGEWG